MASKARKGTNKKLSNKRKELNKRFNRIRNALGDYTLTDAQAAEIYRLQQQKLPPRETFKALVKDVKGALSKVDIIPALSNEPDFTDYLKNEAPESIDDFNNAAATIKAFKLALATLEDEFNLLEVREREEGTPQADIDQEEFLEVEPFMTRLIALHDDIFESTPNNLVVVSIITDIYHKLENDVNIREEA